MTKLSTLVAFAFALAAAACGGGPEMPRAPRGEQVLELRGAIEHAPIAVGTEDLAKVPRGTAHGRDPVTGREETWEGTSLAALTHYVRPRKNAVIDTLVLRTRHGEAVPVPLTMVRQLKPVLVSAEGVPGVLVAWPNLEQRGLAIDPRAPGWWARDVVALEFVPWPQAYGAALAPPFGSSATARVGAGVFAARCVACHTLRGAGGTVGPPLTLVGTSLDGRRFDAAIASHAFERRGLVPPDEVQRGQLWAFLQAVARAPPPEPAGRDEKKDGAGWEDAGPPEAPTTPGPTTPTPPSGS
jgi:mono/diheme cytochrome c family protein